jgi:hypothetical protein
LKMAFGRKGEASVALLGLRVAPIDNTQAAFRLRLNHLAAPLWNAGKKKLGIDGGINLWQRST